MSYHLAEPPLLKIILMFILKSFSKPVPTADVVEVYMNYPFAEYFLMFEYLGQLEHNGFVLSDDGVYSLTELGVSMVGWFGGRVPLSIRNKITGDVKKVLLRRKLKADIVAEVRRVNSVDYAATCGVKDLGDEFYTITLHLPTESAAKEIADRFKRNPQDFTDLVYKFFFGRNECSEYNDFQEELRKGED